MRDPTSFHARNLPPTFNDKINSVCNSVCNCMFKDHSTQSSVPFFEELVVTVVVVVVLLLLSLSLLLLLNQCTTTQNKGISHLESIADEAREANNHKLSTRNHTDVKDTTDKRDETDKMDATNDTEATDASGETEETDLRDGTEQRHPIPTHHCCGCCFRFKNLLKNPLGF